MTFQNLTIFCPYNPGISWIFVLGNVVDYTHQLLFIFPYCRFFSQSLLSVGQLFRSRGNFAYEIFGHTLMKADYTMRSIFKASINNFSIIVKPPIDLHFFFLKSSWNYQVGKIKFVQLYFSKLIFPKSNAKAFQIELEDSKAILTVSLRDFNALFCHN